MRQNCLRSTTQWFPSVPLKELRPYGRYTAWPQLGLPGFGAVTTKLMHLPIARSAVRKYFTDGCCVRQHHWQRKPLANWCSEKRPTLNVQSARNSLSQWTTWALAAVNPRKSRDKTWYDVFSRNISDLLAVEAVSCEPISQFWGLLFL